MPGTYCRYMDPVSTPLILLSNICNVYCVWSSNAFFLSKPTDSSQRKLIKRNSYFIFGPVPVPVLMFVLINLEHDRQILWMVKFCWRFTNVKWQLGIQPQYPMNVKQLCKCERYHITEGKKNKQNVKEKKPCPNSVI